MRRWGDVARLAGLGFGAAGLLLMTAHLRLAFLPFLAALLATTVVPLWLGASSAARGRLNRRVALFTASFLGAFPAFRALQCLLVPHIERPAVMSQQVSVRCGAIWVVYLGLAAAVPLTIVWVFVVAHTARAATLPRARALPETSARARI